VAGGFSAPCNERTTAVPTHSDAKVTTQQFSLTRRRVAENRRTLSLSKDVAPNSRG